MEVCAICVENFNKRKRKQVDCSKCQMSICAECVKTWILTTNDVPQCMNCKCGYTSDFLCGIYSNKFFNGELRDSQVNLFYDTEKSKLVATAQEMEEERLRNKKIKELRDKLNKMPYSYSYPMRDRRRELENELHELRYGKKKVREKSTVNRSCPDNDCRGFLNQAWKCGICEKNTCSKCYCIKKKEHICNQEDIDTFEMLKKDTKQCPNCNYGIYKISGCSQMYCTECHTCFDWGTLRICTGAIHNPHYFEYMRKQKKNLPRQPVDIPGTCLSIHTITSINSKHEAMFLEFFRFFNHIRDVDMRRFPIALPENELNQMRKDYLRNRIHEKEWKKKLKSILKKKEKNTEMTQILEMFCTAGSSILNNLNKHNSDIVLEELEEIKKYTNEQMEKLSSKYKNNVLYITTQGNQLRSQYLDLY